MVRYLKTIEKFYNKKVDATGLAIFRMIYGCILFCVVLELLQYRHLIFDEIPYLRFSNIDYKYVLILWLIVIWHIIMGLFTRIATIINYVLSVVFIATINNFGNHVFNIMVTINFLLMFISVARVYSIDAVIIKIQSPINNIRSSNVSVLNYYSLVFMSLGLMYFISIFDKLFVDYWANGMAIWTFFSIPSEFARDNFSFLLNNKILTQGLTYLSLIFETLFLFLCFRRGTRVIVLVLGVLFHVGILFCFSITYFQLTFLSLYILLIPFSFWSFLKLKCQYRHKTTVFVVAGYRWSEQLYQLLLSIDVLSAFDCKFGDKTLLMVNKSVKGKMIYIKVSDSYIHDYKQIMPYLFKRIPFCMPFVLVIGISRIRAIIVNILKLIFSFKIKSTNDDNEAYLKSYKIKTIASILLLFVILQGHALLDTNFARKIHLPESNIQIKGLARAFFGVTRHNVFTYDYMNSNLKIFSVGISYVDESNEKWLPLTLENGTAGTYKKGLCRTRSFYSNRDGVLDSLQLNNYVRDFTAFWSVNNDIDLDSANFNVYVKKVRMYFNWEKDRYQKSRSIPWTNLGRVVWKDSTYISQLNH